MSQLAIQTDNLTKHYGKTVGCQDVCLAIPAGQVFGFLGPNGAGKSTVVKMLVGLHAPTAGTASIFGHPAGTTAAARLLGFVPELFGVPLWPTAAELLRFYGEVSEVETGMLAGRIDAVLEQVGLPLTVKQQRVGSFSKGMRQRLCIAAALLHQPRLLILDEPTSALDPVGRREIRDLIARLRTEGHTVLLSSHILSDVEMVADHVAIIRQGRIILDGRPTDLASHSMSVTLRVDHLTPAVTHALSALGGLDSREDGLLRLQVRRVEDLGEIAAAVVGAGARLLELTPQRQSLEDLFMGAVREEVLTGA